MKTIVIGDRHNKTRGVNEFIETQAPYEEVVFVGDYFDDFHDNAQIASGTAHWLKESLKDERRIHLVGNHDMPYLLPIENLSQECPGFTHQKDSAINSVLTRKDWNKIRPAYYTQGWMISHAGFSYNLVTHPVLGIPKPEELIKKVEEGFEEVKKGNYHPYFAAGWRMGEPFTGGITWCDWNNEYIPIVGMPQIVGHTPSSFITAKRVTKDQTDYNVDACGSAIIVITDGIAEIVRTKAVRTKGA